MRNIILLLIPVLVLLSSAKPDEVECGDTDFFRITCAKTSGISYCLSDSLIIQSKKIEHDTFIQKAKNDFIDFAISTRKRNYPNLSVLLKDKSSGKIIQSPVIFIATGSVAYGSIKLKKLHEKFVSSSDFSLTLIKIEYGSKDTLRCDLGNLHIDYLKE